MGGRYLAGQRVRMACYALPFVGAALTLATYGFRDSGGNLIDPVAVVLKYNPGGGATVTYTYGGGQIVRDAMGLYHYDVDTTGVSGRWEYEWSDPTNTVYSNTFFVDPVPI